MLYSDHQGHPRVSHPQGRCVEHISFHNEALCMTDLSDAPVMATVFELLHEYPMTARDVGDRLGMIAPTAACHLKKLMHRGLVERTKTRPYLFSPVGVDMNEDEIDRFPPRQIKRSEWVRDHAIPIRSIFEVAA